MHNWKFYMHILNNPVRHQICTSEACPTRARAPSVPAPSSFTSRNNIDSHQHLHRHGSPEESVPGRFSEDASLCELKSTPVFIPQPPFPKVDCTSCGRPFDSATGGQHKCWYTHTFADEIFSLSRPSLATQYPLPNSHAIGISPKASLAYPPKHDTNDKFILSPVLNLPEAFGSAYVGESFSCTLCANNELDPSDTTKSISGVRIQGDMQTPSNPTGSPLELAGPVEGVDTNAMSPGPSESLQRILRFELKEEGNHVLAVTVTYTETLLGEGKAASGRVRTFRKLYQFVAQQLLSVRTKAGEMDQKDGSSRYLLEAQLENMGEAPVCLEVRGVPLNRYFSRGCKPTVSYISSIPKSKFIHGNRECASALAASLHFVVQHLDNPGRPWTLPHHPYTAATISMSSDMFEIKLTLN